MKMNVEVAQLRIARGVKDVEVALDEALLKQSSLFAELITARRETGVEPFVGQAELMRLVKSQQSLLSAGGDIARVHGGLLKVQEDVTGIDRCPPNEPTGEMRSLKKAIGD